MNVVCHVIQRVVSSSCCPPCFSLPFDVREIRRQQRAKEVLRCLFNERNIFFSVRSNLSKPTSAINLITFQSQLHRLMFASMLWKCREIKVWQTIYISRDLNNVWLVISATGFFFFSLANLRSPDARSYLACIFIKQKLITK